MKYAQKAAALLGTAAILLTAGLASAGQTIPGWPAYIAMGAIGGPNITPPTQNSTGGNDDFGGKPVDVVFKYAGFNGAGDPGIIVAPTNVLRMTSDLTTLSAINNRAMRVAIVEYTAQLSGGLALTDFTNAPEPTPATPTGSYILAKHLIGLGADTLAMNDKPVVYNGQSNYGSLIMNPDMLGAIHQGGHIADVNSALPANRVNQAVDMALCFLTTSRTYLNTSNPNGVTAPYVNKTYNGTPVSILEQMYADGYPLWSVESGGDIFWNAAMNNLIGGSGNTYSQVGVWFNGCVSSPTYSSAYQRPNFPAGLDGWIQANNWIIRTMSQKGRVTFGWQENMWPVTSGYWMHAELTDAQIASTYSTPVSNWLQANAPSAITTGALGANYVPDYFVFDRYEFDDSAAPGQATLYNARSWDNFLTGVGQVSKNFNNIPIMLWQIPGGHLPYTGEVNPPLFNNTPGQYVFSTAPVYFFGDSNLTANLGNLIAGPASSSNANTSVGNFQLNCGTLAYNCPNGYTYKQYLLYYKGSANNYNWASGNGRLAFAASNNVFSILWGGGNTTNVIKNFSNPDDHGWLANKIITYYQNPTVISPATGQVAKPHDFNGDGKSDILWRNTSGETGMWLMNGAVIASTPTLGVIGNNWSIVGQRDFSAVPDSKSDLLWLNSAGDIGVWFMNGGSALSTAPLGNVGTTWSVVGTGDFDGDGKADILWRNTSGAVGIWFMNGGTIVSTASLGNPGTNWSVVGTGDFNGDGKRDILWRSTTHDIGIWFMNGGTIASTAPLGNVGATWSVVGTGDFDGGGKTDILWRSTSNDVGIWFMNGGTIASTAPLGNVGAAWNVASVGDYNGDGKSDILWRSTSHDIGVWFMNGGTLISTAPFGNVGSAWQVQNAASN